MLSQANISACTHYRYAWKHSTALAHIHVGNSKGQLALCLHHTHVRWPSVICSSSRGRPDLELHSSQTRVILCGQNHLSWLTAATYQILYLKTQHYASCVSGWERIFFLVHSGALTVYRQFLKSYICHIFFTSSEWQKASSGQILHHYIRNLFQLRFHLYIIHCAHWWYYRPSRYSSPLYAPVCE